MECCNPGSVGDVWVYLMPTCCPGSRGPGVSKRCLLELGSEGGGSCEPFNRSFAASAELGDKTRGLDLGDQREKKIKST